MLLASIIAIGTGCSHSESHLSSLQLDGGNNDGRFEVTVSYPSVVKHGPDVRLLRFEHRSVGSAIVSYKFDVAVEHSPKGCVIRNMMLWSDEQESLRVGSWPGEGFHLRAGESVGQVRDISLASNCRGQLEFAVIAIPTGESPTIGNITITVT
jgi:hypothetical protein